MEGKYEPSSLNAGFISHRSSLDIFGGDLVSFEELVGKQKEALYIHFMVHSEA